MLPREVQLHVPETVDVETARADRSVGDLGLRHLEPGQRADFDLRAELLERDSAREVRRRRGKDVSPVEGRRHGLQRVLAVRDLVGGGDPAELLRRRDEQTVVGPDVEPPVASAQSDRPALATNAGIDDREMHALGEVGERVREHDRPLQHAVRLDPVRDVDDLDLGSDPLHDAVAGADEVVLEPEVGQERDQHVRPKLIDPQRR